MRILHLPFVAAVTLVLFFGVVPVYAALYVTNAFDHTVLRVGDDGGAFSTLVPAGSGGLTNPQRVAFGPDGNLDVASFGIFPTETQEEVLGGILRYDPETGEFLGTFVTGGTGGLRHPSAFASAQTAGSM
jgi:hypothetical protein